jgi:uncharacterized SAM-binding protein YcdF (DUF218 family)
MNSLYSNLKVLTHPEVWIFIALGVTCFTACAKRWEKPARFALIFVVVLYYVVTTRPLAQILAEPLETYYKPPLASAQARQDTIVILVASPKIEPYGERPTILGTGNTDLLLCGLAYLHGDHPLEVVMAGGALDEGALTSSTDIEVLKEWARILGYPGSTIVVQAQTDATSDRVHAIKERVGKERSILLLDEAMHLRRSTGAFRKAGFTVTPVPCYYVTSRERWSLSDFFPDVHYLGVANAAIHEYVGLLVYWLRDFI